jgi:hypothetical protein
MNSQLVTMPSEENLESQSADRARLRGPWLVLARLTWILVALVAVTMLIIGLGMNTIDWWNFTEAVCHDAAHLERINACLATYRAHEQVFGTPKLAAIYHLVGASVEMLPWVLVGGLIFWRKSHEPFALFFSLGLLLVGVLSIDRVTQTVFRNHFPTFMPLFMVLGF